VEAPSLRVAQSPHGPLDSTAAEALCVGLVHRALRCAAFWPDFSMKGATSSCFLLPRAHVLPSAASHTCSCSLRLRPVDQMVAAATGSQPATTSHQHVTCHMSLRLVHSGDLRSCWQCWRDGEDASQFSSTSGHPDAHQSISSLPYRELLSVLSSSPPPSAAELLADPVLPSASCCTAAALSSHTRSRHDCTAVPRISISVKGEDAQHPAAVAIIDVARSGMTT
jgi:hypothetical protein